MANSEKLSEGLRFLGLCVLKNRLLDRACSPGTLVLGRPATTHHSLPFITVICGAICSVIIITRCKILSWNYWLSPACGSVSMLLCLWSSLPTPDWTLFIWISPYSHACEIWSDWVEHTACGRVSAFATHWMEILMIWLCFVVQCCPHPVQCKNSKTKHIS